MTKWKISVTGYEIMERLLLALTDNEPQLGDFVYNTKAGTVDRVIEFDLITRLSKTRQSTIEAAREYSHKVIDINQFLKPNDMGIMKHNNYSDHVIMEEVENGIYKKIGTAFERAADRLGCRKNQTAARYYALRKKGITLKDIDFSEDDKESFDPGDSIPIQRSYDKEKTRPKAPEGYGKPWKNQIGYTERSEAANEGFLSSHAIPDPGWRDPNYLTTEEKEMLKETDQSHIIPNQMKTILVVYTHQETPLTDKQIRGYKLYAFNTPSDLKKGDIIKSEAYSTPIEVVKVMDDSFTYYNRSNGELSNKFTSTEQRELATLIIREDSANTVYGSITNKE